MSVVRTFTGGKIMSSRYDVEVKQHEEWHFATCEALPGLFVGHKEYDVVLKNIPEAIEMLLKNDFGYDDVTVDEAKPTTPTLLGNKTFVAKRMVAANA